MFMELALKVREQVFALPQLFISPMAEQAPALKIGR